MRSSVADTNCYGNGNCYSDGNCYCYCYCYSNTNAHTYADSKSYPDAQTSAESTPALLSGNADLSAIVPRLRDEGR